jgi:hypothetical protein
MAAITLNGGFVALVDDDDEKRVNKYNWNVQRAGRTHYARTVIGGSIVSLHRYVIRAKPRLIIDHISGDGLDNRKSNLRIVTVSQNQMNARKSLRRKGTTSQYKGVSFKPEKAYRRPWRVRIYVKGRRIDVGCYADEEDAARAYDAAAKRYFGEYAKPNFKN